MIELVGATIERINYSYETIAGEELRWIESFWIRAIPSLGGKLYELTCYSLCPDDDYGRECEAAFDIGEIEE